MPALQKEMQASSTRNFRYYTCLLDKGAYHFVRQALYQTLYHIPYQTLYQASFLFSLLRFFTAVESISLIRFS